MESITLVDHTDDLGGKADRRSLKQAAGQSYRPGVELAFGDRFGRIHQPVGAGLRGSGCGWLCQACEKTAEADSNRAPRAHCLALTSRPPISGVASSSPSAAPLRYHAAAASGSATTPIVPIACKKRGSYVFPAAVAARAESSAAARW